MAQDFKDFWGPEFARLRGILDEIETLAGENTSPLLFEKLHFPNVEQMGAYLDAIKKLFQTQERDRQTAADNIIQQALGTKKRQQ